MGLGIRASDLSFTVKDATAAAHPSLGNFPHFDMWRFKTVFPDRWSAFLRAHFRCAHHVAAFFDVDDHTARSWWHAKHAPAAPFALRAVAQFPDALPMLMGEAA